MGRLDEWRFCPRCAAPVVPAGGSAACAACGFVGWANPAPTASAFVEDHEGRLLLGRRAGEPFQGLWDTVGGYLHEGEHPLDALVREVREETGLEVVPGDYAGCWMDTYGPPGPGVVHTLNLFWRVHVPAPAPGEAAQQPVAADDVAELRWFAPHELPPRDQLAFECVPLAIEHWRRLKVAENGEGPA